LRAKAFGSVWLGSLLRWLTGRVIGEHDHGDFPVARWSALQAKAVLRSAQGCALWDCRLLLIWIYDNPVRAAYADSVASVWPPANDRPRVP
jgi:hypothetical protein